MEIPKIRKLEDKGGIEIDLCVGRESSACGSGPDLASGLNFVTVRRISDFWM